MTGNSFPPNIDINTCDDKKSPAIISRRISRFDAVAMVSMVVVCLIDIIMASYCMNNSTMHVYVVLLVESFPVVYL